MNFHYTLAKMSAYGNQHFCFQGGEELGTARLAEKRPMTPARPTANTYALHSTAEAIRTLAESLAFSEWNFGAFCFTRISTGFFNAAQGPPESSLRIHRCVYSHESSIKPVSSELFTEVLTVRRRGGSFEPLPAPRRLPACPTSRSTQNQLAEPCLSSKIIAEDAYRRVLRDFVKIVRTSCSSMVYF